MKKGRPYRYSITERRVPEPIPVLGSQPAGDAVCVMLDSRCGGFAAESPAGGTYISIDSGGRRRSAATAPQHGIRQQMRAVSC